MLVRKFRYKAVMLVLAAFVSQGCAVKDQSAEPRLAAAATGQSAASQSYVESASNEMVVDNVGDCIRTVSWSADDLDNRCVEVPAAQKKAPGSVLVSFNSRALFDFDSSALTSAGQAELDKLTSKLNTQVEIEAIEIVGHADSVGTEQYNQSLSESRADVVMRYLQRSLQNVAVSSVGVGESTPVANNDTEEGRRVNRRVDVKVAAKVEQ